MLLLKGTLEPSMFELLANVFRQRLPKDVFLHRPHVLRSQKTGPEQLPKHNATPRIQVFPYRSNSKMWAVFLITSTEEGHELHVVRPEKYDVEAFDWATNHLRCQYKVQKGNHLRFMAEWTRFRITSFSRPCEGSARTHSDRT